MEELKEIFEKRRNEKIKMIEEIKDETQKLFLYAMISENKTIESELKKMLETGKIEISNIKLLKSREK